MLPSRFGRYHIHSAVHRPCASDDAGPGVLLRGHGPRQKRADHHDAKLHFHGHHRHHLDFRRFQPGLRAGHRRSVRRHLLPLRPGQSGGHAQSALCHHRAFHPVLRLPAYVRHHHPGPDYRGLCGAFQLAGLHPIPHPVDDPRVYPGLPLDMGRRLPVQAGRGRLCGRHCGPRQRRFFGPVHRYFLRPAPQGTA